MEQVQQTVVLDERDGDGDGDGQVRSVLSCCRRVLFLRVASVSLAIGGPHARWQAHWLAVHECVQT